MGIQRFDSSEQPPHLTREELHALVQSGIQKAVEEKKEFSPDQIPVVPLDDLQAVVYDCMHDYIAKDAGEHFLALTHALKDIIRTKHIEEAEEQIPPKNVRFLRLAVFNEIMKLWREERRSKEGINLQSEELFKLARKLGIFGEYDAQGLAGMKAAEEVGHEKGSGPGKDRQ